MWNWHLPSAAVAAVLCGFLAAVILSVEGENLFRLIIRRVQLTVDFICVF